MRKAQWGFLIVSLLCCCSLLMAAEHDNKVKNKIPKSFIGQWIENREDSKEPGKITISEKGIVWEQSGADTETINAEGITLSGDNQKLLFSSAVVVIKGRPIPDTKLDCKASVIFTIDKDDLVVELSGIREKVKRCGAVPEKGCAGITRQIVDGEMLTCIAYSPRVHRYKKRN